MLENNKKNELENENQENTTVENENEKEEIFAEPEIAQESEPQMENIETTETESEDLEVEKIMREGQEDLQSEAEQTEETAQPEAEKQMVQTAAAETGIPQAEAAGETPAQKKKHKKSMNIYAKTVCCAILFGAIAGGMIMGSSLVSRNVITNNTSIETTASKLSTAAAASNTETEETSGETYSVAEIVAQCKSSVVAITNYSVSEVQSMFGVMQQESTSSGSGVIIGKNDSELLIVTNYHVISGSETLSVCFNDDENAVFNAQVKGTDSENDLAVLSIKLADIDEDVLASISIATVGDSTELEVGDDVVAIGNALGFGQSVTSGIVSAVEREVTLDDSTAILLQTNAAINPGNSGGALFNAKGELIGINTAKYASEEVEGMGFAIPMATAQPIVEELMNQETRDKLSNDYGYLNIKGQDVDTEASEMYGIPEGVYVSEATAGGAAANAGIQSGDIITSLDGKSVTTISQLKEELQYYAAGESVEITIQRNSNGGYQEQTVTVTLDNASEQQTSASESQQSGDSSTGRDYLEDGMQQYQDGFSFGIN